VRRRSTRVGWALATVWTASVAALWALSVANGTFAPDALTDSVPLLLAFGAFMVVGALIVAHRPGNAIGWIFSAIALLATIGALAEEYAIYATATRPGALPAPVLAAWLAAWTWFPTIALALAYTPLLFPTGRPPTPRWRPVAWLAGAATGRSRRWPPSSPPWRSAARWSTTRSACPGSRTPRGPSWARSCWP
jgi:hypothetical protein